MIMILAINADPLCTQGSINKIFDRFSFFVTNEFQGRLTCKMMSIEIHRGNT